GLWLRMSRVQIPSPTPFHQGPARTHSYITFGSNAVRPGHKRNYLYLYLYLHSSLGIEACSIAEAGVKDFSIVDRWERDSNGGLVGRIVDGFYKREAAAALAAVADRLLIIGNGAEKILENGLVATEIGDCGRG